MMEKGIFTYKWLAIFLFVVIGCAKSADEPLPTTEVPSPQIDVLTEELKEIDKDIEEGVYGETHSLLVFRDGDMLIEEYYEPFSETELHYQYSVTKSVTSALIGIALDKDLIKNVDQKLLAIFPEYTDVKNLERIKKAISLDNLLAMRAGFEWDEWTYPYTDDRNDVYGLITSNDMVKHMLDKPMAHVPGARFTYNSGVSILLSGIIQKVSGKSTEAFAEEHLFKPLGIKSWQWETGNSDNLNNSGWGLHLLPKDMMKIGQLFLNEGNWEGQQIISKEWVHESTKVDRGDVYGYQWWLRSDQLYYSARGWGGQFIFVVPKYNVVFVTTAGNFSNNSGAGNQIFQRILRKLED